MPYYVYILFSKSFDKFYIGQTDDVANRLHRHNSGYEKATNPYRPWQMVWVTNKESRAATMQLEKKLKNLSKGRIREFIKKYQQ